MAYGARMEYDSDIVRKLVDGIRYATYGAHPPRHVYMALVTAIHGMSDWELLGSVVESDAGTRWELVCFTDSSLVTLEAESQTQQWAMEESGEGEVPQLLSTYRCKRSALRAVEVTGVVPGTGTWAAHEWRAQYTLHFDDGRTFRLDEPRRDEGQETLATLVTSM